jgi:pyridoxine 5-phosphate synthase
MATPNLNLYKTALSVNVNKVALLRNTRHLGIPSVTKAAQICLQSGAAGITVHPRPDERHIRSADVYELADLMQAWPEREYNIEGNPFHNMMDFIRTLRARGLPCHQATFVPDSVEQSTSDHGWIFPQDAARLQPLVDECHALGVRVSLFMDPVPAQMAAAKALGADRVELYTETWASAWGKATQKDVLAQFTATSIAARAVGLGINAGHDLNRENLTAFLAAVPGVAEVSIGHAFVGDALEMGYEATTRAYLHYIDAAYGA